MKNALEVAIEIAEEMHEIKIGEPAEFSPEKLSMMCGRDHLKFGFLRHLEEKLAGVDIVFNCRNFPYVFERLK